MTDALSIARDLIRCPSVTPADAGALGVLEQALNAVKDVVIRPDTRLNGVADAHHVIIKPESRLALNARFEKEQREDRKGEA